MNIPYTDFKTVISAKILFYHSNEKQFDFIMMVWVIFRISCQNSHKKILDRRIQLFNVKIKLFALPNHCAIQPLKSFSPPDDAIPLPTIHCLILSFSSGRLELYPCLVADGLTSYKVLMALPNAGRLALSSAKGWLFKVYVHAYIFFGLFYLMFILSLNIHAFRMLKHTKCYLRKHVDSYHSVFYAIFPV